MTSRPVYYVNYLDPKTGFLKREEFYSHRDKETRIAELRKTGIIHITEGSYRS